MPACRPGWPVACTPAWHSPPVWRASSRSLGLLLAFGLRSLIGVIPWFAAVVGAILAVLGMMMLAGARLPLRLPSTRAGTLSRGPLKMVAFGVGSALASASCTLAILLAVVTQALATSNLSGVLVVFGAYAAGAATLLLTLALFAAFASTAISRYLRRLLQHMHKITGAVLAVSGGYLLLYWLPQLVGHSQPGLNPLTGVVGMVSVWITAHQVPITITVLTLRAATTLVIVLPRRRKADNSADADCCPVRDVEPGPRR